jgi:hypothetical protein
MASAASVWPQAALQRFQALEPDPFVPQRLGLHLLEAPKPPTARPRVVAAAYALPEAPLVGAEAERSQQIALRTPDQIVAHARWPRQPLFEREPPREASRESSPRHGLMFSPRHHRSLFSSSPPGPFLFVTTGLDRWSMLKRRVQLRPLRVPRSPMDRRVKPGDDEPFRCRDAPSHPTFAHAKKTTPRKAKPKSIAKKTPPLKKKGGGAPTSASTRSRIEKRCSARPFSCLPHCGKTEAAGTSWSGRARLSAPHRGIRAF